MTEAAWTELCEALSAEVERLAEMREHADRGAALMLAMDIPGIEAWAQEQQSLLRTLAELAARRTEALAACLPRGTLARGSGRGLAARVTLLAVIQFAPQWVARRLRPMRDRLRQLRDELALVTSRNEILIRQALEFTEDLGRSLAPQLTPAAGYDARGVASSSTTGTGELLELSL